MRILICGSRAFTDYDFILSTLKSYNATVVIDGTAHGADTLGYMAAQALGLKSERYPADWNKYGRRAGTVRNQQMLDEGKPSQVLAFWDGKSNGTRDMISRAKRAGIPTEVFIK